MIRCGVRGIGVLGPGLPDWERGRAVLAGERNREPADIGRVVAPDLPRTEARRATLTTHLALSAASQAMLGQAPPGDDMPSVWAAADSDLQGLEKNCRTLADEPPWISPHRFQNSVHNTPSGYWSIATGCRGPATAICSGPVSFAAGLVEALTMLVEGHERCLLVSSDEVSPATLGVVRAVPFSFAVALLLSRDPAHGLALGLERVAAATTGATPCTDAGLERLRAGNPAARSLPLLCALASGVGAAVDVPWTGCCLRLHTGVGA